jgi:hypothetical protein
VNDDQQYSIQRVRLGAAIAVALAVAFLIWLIFIRNGDDETTPRGQPAAQVEPFGPEVATRAGLRDAAAELGHEIYWAGPDEPGRVELTVSRNGQAFVRYLTGGAEPGRAGGRPDFLTVATYPLGDAFAATSEVAGREGRESFEVDGGGIAVFSTGNPERVYFAYPDSALQVEVFDPDPGRARDLVEADRIVPIG